MEHSYLDIIENRIERDDRTGDEVAADVIERYGLKVEE